MKNQKKTGSSGKNRPEFQQVQLRIRPDLLEVLDAHVEGKRAVEIASGAGRATSTRTSVIMQAIAAEVGHLGAVDE